MNAEMGNQAIDVTLSGRFRTMWASGRLTLFCCFMLSGIVLDAYCVWFRLAANCQALVPFPLCIGISIVPAMASIVFAPNAYYRDFCFVLWATCCLVCAYLVATNEQLNGICWRERAGDADTEIALIAAAVSAALATMAVTFVFGVFVLAKRQYAVLRRVQKV